MEKLKNKEKFKRNWKKWKLTIENRFKDDISFFRKRNWEGDGYGGGVKDYLDKKIVPRIEGILKKDNPIIVEIGSGMSNALKELANSHPNIKPIGIDIYPEDSKSKKSRDANSKPYIIQADIGGINENDFSRVGIPLKDNSIDFVYTIQTYRYLVDKLNAISEICRVLKKDGLAVIHLGRKLDISVTEKPSLEEIIKIAGLSDSMKIKIIELDDRPQITLEIDASKLPNRIDWNMDLINIANINDREIKSIYDFID